MPHDTEAEFAAFFTATWARLYRTTYAVAGNRQLAEDSLQSAFAKAYASWRRVSAADQPEAYVRKMAVNEVLSTRRRAWWKAERTGITVDPPTDRPGDPSPEGQVLDHDVVWAAVLDLPPGQRAVLVLRYYEDLSERDIAEALGCSTGTVKSQASAALRSLRRVMEPSASEQENR